MAAWNIIIVSAAIAVFVAASSAQVGLAEPRISIGREVEFRAADSGRDGGDMEAAAPEQQPIGGYQQASLRKQLLELKGNNVPDVAALLFGGSRHLRPIRLQRSTAALSSQNSQMLPLAQQAFGGASSSSSSSNDNSQQLLEDEYAMRRRLPDLIAQARNDKAVERALLSMLFNASLRSGLGNVVGAGPQQQGATASNNYGFGGTPVAWQEGADALAGSGPEGGLLRGFELESPAARGLTARQLEQALEGGYGAALEQQDAGLPGGAYQASAMPEKREYIKPCSFNAVSCAKNPYRKAVR